MACRALIGASGKNKGVEVLLSRAGVKSTCSTTGFCRQLITYLGSLSLCKWLKRGRPYRVTSTYGDVDVRDDYYQFPVHAKQELMLIDQGIWHLPI